MIDASELPTAPIEYTADPEQPIDPNLSLPEPDINPWPAPEVTSYDPWPEDVEVPRSVASTMKAAEKAGWQARRGYSRGSIPGQARGSWKIRESIAVWLMKSGRTRMVFAWERDPESQAKSGPTWKPTTCIEFDAGNARAYGHLVGKKLL